MNYLHSLRRRLPVGDRLRAMLPLIAIAAILIAYLPLIGLAIVPQARTWRALSAELDAARRTVAEPRGADGEAADDLRRRIAAAEAELAEAQRAFLSPAQAEQVLARLEGRAGECRVQVLGRQDQLARKVESQALYGARTVRVRAAGTVPGLICFACRFQEATHNGVALTNVSLAEGQGRHELAMDVVLYTSPQSSDEPLPPPAGPPGPVAASVGRLEAGLAAPWAAGEWPRVIALVEQILALDPARGDMEQKLYAAHVNHGHHLLEAGDQAAAEAEFNLALQVRPGGREAVAGLALAVATPTPTPTVGPPPTATPAPRYAVYTVKTGDALYTIAVRYGTTVQALMTINQLDSTEIQAGQQLYVPVN